MDAGNQRRGGTPHRGASQRQVADHAGVSPQTVSRVANGGLNVDPLTRDRVLASMQALGYRRNRVGLALRSGRYHTLGVVMPTLSSYGNTRTWESLAVAADHEGYGIILMPLERRDPEAVTTAVERLGDQPVDGVVLLIEQHFLAGDRLSLPTGLPVVVVDSTGQDGRALVDTDQGLGARQATEHLLDLGHPTVHHIAGPRESYAAERREAGWRHTLAERGRPVPAPMAGDWTPEAGYRAGLSLADRPDVSAVFVANDQMALGALRAFHERGVRVPDDVSVVGFDDMPEASAFWPPLTTIWQDFEGVGRIAVASVLAEIRGQRPDAGAVLVPTRLVPRASTGPYSGKSRR